MTEIRKRVREQIDPQLNSFFPQNIGVDDVDGAGDGDGVPTSGCFNSSIVGAVDPMTCTCSNGTAKLFVL